MARRKRRTQSRRCASEKGIGHVSFIRAASDRRVHADNVHNELLGRAVFVATILVHLVERLDAVTQFRPLTNTPGGVEPTTKGFGSETALVKRTRSSSRIIRLTSRNTLLSANEIIPQLDTPAIAFARYRVARRIFGDDSENVKLLCIRVLLTDTNFGTIA